jgi:hypothetical protein
MQLRFGDICDDGPGYDRGDRPVSKVIAPSFHQSFVLLLRHDAQGALGLVVNQRTDRRGGGLSTSWHCSMDFVEVRGIAARIMGSRRSDGDVVPRVESIVSTEVIPRFADTVRSLRRPLPSPLRRFHT